MMMILPRYFSHEKIPLSLQKIPGGGESQLATLPSLQLRGHGIFHYLLTLTPHENQSKEDIQFYFIYFSV